MKTVQGSLVYSLASIRGQAFSYRSDNMELTKLKHVTVHFSLSHWSWVWTATAILWVVK